MYHFKVLKIQHSWEYTGSLWVSVIWKKSMLCYSNYRQQTQILQHRDVCKNCIQCSVKYVDKRPDLLPTPLSKPIRTRTRWLKFFRTFTKLKKSFEIIFKKFCLRKITRNFYIRFFGFERPSTRRHNFKSCNRVGTK